MKLKNPVLSKEKVQSLIDDFRYQHWAKESFIIDLTLTEYNRMYEVNCILECIATEKTYTATKSLPKWANVLTVKTGIKTVIAHCIHYAAMDCLEFK